MALINFKIPMILIFLSFTCQAVLGICDVNSCNDPTKCLKSADLVTCKCRMGLYDTQCDMDAKITVVCTSEFITLSVAEGYFQYYNTPIETLHLTHNESCPTAIQKEVVDGEGFYVLRLPKYQYPVCGGKPLEKNVTHIIYSLSLASKPQVYGKIVRDPIIQIEYKCIYPYHRMVSLPFPVLPYVSEAQLRVDDLDATIQMTLYTDDTYTQVYEYAPTIELLDTVYVQVKVTEPQDFFNLRLNDCWATQTTESNATDVNLSHMLLDDGCVTEEDDTMKFLPLSQTVDQLSDQINGRGSTVRFSFQMFRFSTVPHNLYLHCSLVICEDDQDHREDCMPSCPVKATIAKREVATIAKREVATIAKREVATIAKRELATPGLNQGLLSYGPIKIVMPQPAESSGVMKMVALPVAGIWAVGLMLVLLIAVAKAGNRRLQRSQENH